jgi:hypothetical protein
MKLWFRSFLRNKGEELSACLYFCINNRLAPLWGSLFFLYYTQFTILDYYGVLKYIYFHIKKLTAVSTCFTRIENGILGQLKYIKKTFGVQFCNNWQSHKVNFFLLFLSVHFLKLSVYFLNSFLSTFSFSFCLPS